MSAMYFRPVVTYPTRCVAPVFFARQASAPAPVTHTIVPLFSLLDDSLAQLDNHLRQVQRQRHIQRQCQTQFKRPFNPKFDVKEDKESYSLEGELPGFDAKDISIEFLDDGHTLRIKGETVKEFKKERTTADVEAVAAEAVEATETSEKVVADAPAAQATSETSSVKTHQATVEDDVEEPANASATVAAAADQTTAELSKPAEQQITEPVKTQEPKVQAKNWISERYTGSFTRSFRFPSKVDQQAVRASLKDGILAVTLPLARKPESRRIRIE